VWFPKTCQLKRVIDSDGSHHREKSEVAFTRITLNPDHEKLGSFLPDDIPNGTKVHVLPSTQTFIWQDGEIIADNGKNAGD
jgi:hypothetical protein